MFKKVNMLLCAAASLFLVASCGESKPSTGDDDFDQNDNPTVQGFEMYVIGSHWNSWTPATIKEAEGCAFKKDSSSGLYTIDFEVTQDMIDAWCGFKFIADNSWTSQYGMEDLNWEKCNDTFKEQFKNEDGSQKTKKDWKEGTSNRSNVVMTTPGKVHIEYNPANFESEEANSTTYTNKFVITLTK